MPSSTVIKDTLQKEPTESTTTKDSDSDSFAVNADAVQKQKNMLRNMSTHGLVAKWGYLKKCSPMKNKARALARKIEKELIRRGALVEGDDSDSTLTEGSSCGM